MTDTTLTQAIAQATADREAGKRGKCCFEGCTNEYDNWGHNPHPLRSAFTSGDAPGFNRCCDECNTSRVVPARAMTYFRREGQKKKLADAIATRRLQGRR